MQKSLVWILAAALVITPVTPAFAQEKPKFPRLRSFTLPTVEVKSTEEMANVILKCKTDNTPWRISCDKLVEEFNKLGRYEPVADYKELAEFYRDETKIVPCRFGMEVEIAGVRGQEVEYFSRPLREKEMCFGHTGTNTLVSSESCFQYIKTEVPIYSTALNQEPNPTPSTPSTLGREERRDDGLVTPKSSYAEKEPDHRNILERNKGKLIGVGLGVVAAAGTVALLRGFPKQEVCVFSSVCR